MAGREQTVNPAHADHGEVKRPDTKNTPQIKGWNADSIRIALFTQQQLRNQVRAKKEKDADAEFPRASDGSELSGLVEVPDQAMGKENQQKSEDTENIQARTVKTVRSRLGRPSSMTAAAEWDIPLTSPGHIRP
ncbi:MAG: hypothetical protein QOH35_2823 [Acidobacteriaceae bacterium]|nr:hypothetical protein [Acidobacteriaceae bacterium]MEA2260369.1 hypothetical protein [Acidobacteriaceae bacterium]MEA2541457.1 hypothetical protein [Acidobacteriaceae bacterium]